ncbi:putative cucumisin [Rosa chinensis]|uniref:Putative cucumisin n=1 Tax=Rosa chinensis TaxID=74649 RepID=A0A2P6Q2F5_ROSCH|nr:putative cucumisin [Rosa chinensis]
MKQYFSEVSKAHVKQLEDSHDQLLQSNLETGSYSKLYSFKQVANGFAVHTTPSQVEKLKYAPAVKLVERDRGAKLMTTYTPRFLELPEAVWTQEGAQRNAGEGIVIGFTGPLFPATSCNGKIVSAKFFSAGARAIATLNGSVDFLSPFDADGHGSHVASVAAGNAGVPVVVNGFSYGRAGGMAPRARDRIAVYKAVYPTVGTLADVVSAIDEAIRDGVDVLALSVGPDEPPLGKVTFLSMFDVFMLYARRAGVFVVQAASNRGPDPSRPTFGYRLLQHRLVLAKDAINPIGSFPRTYVEECQFPQALDTRLVIGSIVICTFSDGFYNGRSTLNAIVNTARALGFMGFVLVANPAYGDFIAEPVPFAVSGILVPSVTNSQVHITKSYS